MSLGAHDTGQNLVVDIRRTGKTTALGNGVVQESSVVVCLTAKSVMRVPVHTHEFSGSLVQSVGRHHVPFVLHGPSAWACVGARYHHGARSWRSVHQVCV